MKCPHFKEAYDIGMCMASKIAHIPGKLPPFLRGLDLQEGVFLSSSFAIFSGGRYRF